MSTFIKRIKGNTVLTILTAFFLGIVVFFTSLVLSLETTSLIGKYIELQPYMEHVVFKLYILILSVVMIWFVNNKSIENYGFKKPKKINYLKMAFITIAVTLISLTVGEIIFIDILGQSPSSETMNAFSKLSLLQTILTIWLWSSITEEFLVRGLIQGFMNHLKNKKVMGLSIPVIFSGLFFGAMHITTGVAYIVFFTTIGGFVMAYYREKSDSILPAIYVHILANVTGFALYFLQTLS